jgi:hypothetical protein
MKLCARPHRLVGLLAIPLVLLTASPTDAAPPQPAKPARKAKAPPPKAMAAQPPAAAGERIFDFEKRTGALDEALTVLLGRQRPVLPTAEEDGKRMARVASARQVVRSNAKAAAEAVIAELQTLPKSDVEGHAELFSLLGVVAGEDAAIEYWSRKLTSGEPRRPKPIPERKKLKEPDRPKVERSENEDPEVVIRYLAIAHLYRAARAGSEKARAAILEAAASPHREVRISAVQYTYAVTRRRWQARQELEKRLPPSDQYLLYRY